MSYLRHQRGMKFQRIALTWVYSLCFLYQLSWRQGIGGSSINHPLRRRYGYFSIATRFATFLFRKFDFCKNIFTHFTGWLHPMISFQTISLRVFCVFVYAILQFFFRNLKKSLNMFLCSYHGFLSCERTTVPYSFTMRVLLKKLLQKEVQQSTISIEAYSQPLSVLSL